MNRFVIVFLSFACVLSEIAAFSFDGVKDSNGLIRLPLTPRKRRAADDMKKVALGDLDGDVHYSVPVQIGTPPQTFDVMLDTGSADLWVASVKAKDNPQCSSICGDLGAKNFFDEKASSTFQSTGRDFYIGYVGASTNGSAGLDTVSIGGLTATNQPIGLANAGWTPGKLDGIWGFSYAVSSEMDNSTFLDRLYEQGKIKERTACIKLREEKKGKSEFILGGCDVEAVEWKTLIRLDNVYTGWKVTLDKLVVRSPDGDSELLTLSPNHQAVLDTGAQAKIGVPTKYMKKIAETVGATLSGRHYVVDCDKRTQLPNLDLYFGRFKITLTYDNYSFKYFDECQLALYDNGEDSSFLCGTILFHQATIVFDKENNMLGFAPV